MQFQDEMPIFDNPLYPLQYKTFTLMIHVYFFCEKEVWSDVIEVHFWHSVEMCFAIVHLRRSWGLKIPLKKRSQIETFVAFMIHFLRWCCRAINTLLNWTQIDVKLSVFSLSFLPFYTFYQKHFAAFRRTYNFKKHDAFHHKTFLKLKRCAHQSIGCLRHQMSLFGNLWSHCIPWYCGVSQLTSFFTDKRGFFSLMMQISIRCSDCRYRCIIKDSTV